MTAIELSKHEREAGVDALREASSDNFGYGFGTALDRIIGAINLVREGDAIGTIRRDGKSYAVRRRYGWLLVHPDHLEEVKAPIDLSRWRVIYTVELDS